LRAVDNVFKLRPARLRHLQTNSKRFTRSGATVRFLFRQAAKRIAALVHALACMRTGALGNSFLHGLVVALLLRREITIGFTLGDKTLRGRAMLVCIGRLEKE